MSLVGRVGRKRWRARVALGFLYALLCLGAVTTIYPFILMVTTGLKGPTDQNDNRIVPAYWRDDSELADKYVDDKYGGNTSLIASTRIGGDSDARTVALYREFLIGLPNDHWTAGFRIAPQQVTSRLSRKYQAWLRARFKNDVDALNRAYIEENLDILTAEPPAELFERAAWVSNRGRKWDDWQTFKAALPAEFRIPIRTQRLWQEFVRAKHQGDFRSVPEGLKAGATAFENLPLQEADPLYAEFAATALPKRYRDGQSTEAIWARFLRSKGVDKSVAMPIAAEEAATVREQAQPLRREFAGRNFVYVLDYILLNGRAVVNTAAFCLLAILTQLIVNPLAAYALSRYPVRQSGKILIFLLATMAFPAEVAMIPSFLLLKDLGLLNTFAALVLPGAASGYMIFLLKGFFDSLPQELFEAGSLDGAKEITMMTRIALPLSRPVLGYLALLAFMGAYGAFMFAFLIVQDQRMWTLMVFLYQLQNYAPRSVMMAALTLSALPTLVVFLLAQRVIMRGIVLPGER